MGDDLKLRESSNSQRQFRNVRKIVVHEKYDPEIQQNDVALTILGKPFYLTNTFNPVNVTDVGPVDNEICRIGK